MLKRQTTMFLTLIKTKKKEKQSLFCINSIRITREFRTGKVEQLGVKLP